MGRINFRVTEPLETTRICNSVSRTNFEKLKKSLQVYKLHSRFSPEFGVKLSPCTCVAIVAALN